MSSHPRRRWYAFSLRTLLVAVTVAAVACTWFPYRQRRIAQQQRLQALSDGGSIGLEFADSLCGWDLPEPELVGWRLSAQGYLVSGNMTYNDPHSSYRAVSVPLIRSIDVSEHYMYGEDLPPKWLPEALAMPGLKELKVSLYDSTMVQFLARFRPDIDTLKLADPYGEPLAPLGEWPSVRHLLVDFGLVDDAMLTAIIDQFPNLESLEFGAESGCDYDITPQAIASLARLRRLTTLRLDVCDLQREHLTAIARLQNLTRLSLWGQTLDADDCRELKKLPRLRMINLDPAEVPADAFPEIRGDWRPPPRHPLCTSILPVVG